MYSVISYDVVRSSDSYELVKNIHSSNGSIFQTETIGNFLSVDSCKDFIVSEHENDSKHVDNVMMLFTKDGDLLKTYENVFGGCVA